MPDTGTVETEPQSRLVCSWCFDPLPPGQRAPVYISRRNGTDWLVCRRCHEANHPSDSSMVDFRNTDGGEDVK